MADRYVGDIGQSLLITPLGFDPLTYTTRVINVRKPNGSSVAWTPSSVTSTLITYVFQSGDLNVAGAYNGSVQLTTPGQVTTTPFQFVVGTPP